MRIVKVFISSTGQKRNIQDNTINQNSSDSYIELYSETFYTNVNITFKFPNAKLSPDYHMIYEAYDEDSKSYKYSFNIPVAITSFVMPTPTAKLEVSFKCWSDDESVYLKGTTVAGTQITVNRSNNSDVLDASYNGTDVNNLWDTMGKLTNKLNNFEVGNSEYYVPETKFEELVANVPTEIVEKNEKLYLSHDGAILNGDRQAGLSIEAKKVIIDPITAVHGTFTAEQFAILSASRRNYIERNQEIYKLTDDQFEGNYLTYAHASMVHNDKTGVIKSIRINIETRFWEFMEFEFEPKLPTPTQDGTYILTCTVDKGIKTYNWEAK